MWECHGLVAHAKLGGEHLVPGPLKSSGLTLFGGSPGSQCSIHLAPRLFVLTHIMACGLCDSCSSDHALSVAVVEFSLHQDPATA